VVALRAVRSAIKGHGVLQALAIKERRATSRLGRLSVAGRSVRENGRSRVCRLVLLLKSRSLVCWVFCDGSTSPFSTASFAFIIPQQILSAMREWRNTFHTNFCRIDPLGDDLICLVVIAGFREGLLISGFQLLQVQGSYGPHRLQVQT